MELLLDYASKLSRRNEAIFYEKWLVLQARDWYLHLFTPFRRRFDKDNTSYLCRDTFCRVCQITGKFITLFWLTVSAVHIENFFRKLIRSTRNQIVFTFFRLNWNQTHVRLVPNQSENDNYNLISVWFNNISKRFLCE